MLSARSKEIVCRYWFEIPSAVRIDPPAALLLNPSSSLTTHVEVQRNALSAAQAVRTVTSELTTTARTVRRHLGSVELRSTRRFSFTSLRRFDEKTFLNQKQRGHRGTNGCPLALAYLGLRLVKSRSASTNVRKEAHLPDYVYIYFLLGK